MESEIGNEARGDIASKQHLRGHHDADLLRGHALCGEHAVEGQVHGLQARGRDAAKVGPHGREALEQRDHLQKERIHSE